jgi:hypothetical protein
MTIVTRTGKQALFAAVIEPTRAGKEPAVTSVTAEETPEGIKVTIQGGRGSETHPVA